MFFSINSSFTLQAIPLYKLLFISKLYSPAFFNRFSSCSRLSSNLFTNRSGANCDNLASRFKHFWSFSSKTLLKLTSIYEVDNFFQLLYASVNLDFISALKRFE